MEESHQENGFRAAMLRGDAQELCTTYGLSQEAIGEVLRIRSGRIILTLCYHILDESPAEIEKKLCDIYGYVPKDARAIYDQRYFIVDHAAREPFDEQKQNGLTAGEIDYIRDRRADMIGGLAVQKNWKKLAELGFYEQDFRNIVLSPTYGMRTGIVFQRLQQLRKNMPQ